MLTDERAAILTVDIITPVVGDLIFGDKLQRPTPERCLRHGRKTLLTLNVVGFPINCMPLEVLSSILEGSMERTTRAGAIVAGGHTIEDEEPKFGLVVYGEVPLTEIWYTKGAKPGDKIILTKP